MQNDTSIFRGLRALIADPDLRFVSSLKNYLEDLGFSVMTADSAHDAESLAGENLDLLITEIMLEFQDSGFILAHRIRRTFPHTRIVIISGVTFKTGLHFDLADEESRSWIEADAILDKDIRFEQLRPVLNQLFKTRNRCCNG